jgi:hypothetical protein
LIRGKVILNVSIKYLLALLQILDISLLLNVLLVIVSAIDKKYLLKDSAIILVFVCDLFRTFKLGMASAHISPSFTLNIREMCSFIKITAHGTRKNKLTCI